MSAPPDPANLVKKSRVDWFLVGMVAVTLLAWLFPDPGARGGASRRGVEQAGRGAHLLPAWAAPVLRRAASRRAPVAFAPGRAAVDLRRVSADRARRAAAARWRARSQPHARHLLSLRAAVHGLFVGGDDRRGARQRARRGVQRHTLERARRLPHSALGRRLDGRYGRVVTARSRGARPGAVALVSTRPRSGVSAAARRLRCAAQEEDQPGRSLDHLAPGLHFVLRLGEIGRLAR